MNRLEQSKIERPSPGVGGQVVVRMPDGRMRPLMMVPGRNPAEEHRWFDLRTFKAVPMREWLDAGAAVYDLADKWMGGR